MPRHKSLIFPALIAALSLIGTLGITHPTHAGWVAQTSGIMTALRAVYFSDASIGLAVGDGGVIRKTLNGGSTWATSTSGTTARLNDISIISGTSIAYVVGEGGVIRKSIDLGAIWSAQTSGIMETLTGVYFVDASNGWVVGASGRILHTTNGGSTWTAQTSGTGSYLSDVYFTDSQNGWVVGDDGVVLNTTNGTSWSNVTPGSPTLSGVYFVNASTGWVVGASGTIRLWDASEPSAPTGLTRTSATSDTTPTFTWNASTDNVGVTSYHVQIQNSMEANVISDTDLGNVLTYTVPDGSALSVGTYTFLVNAHDAAGNSSSPFTTLGFTISAPANTPPNVPTELAQRNVYNGPDQPVGYIDSDGGIIFKAVLSDPDTSQTLQLQVEIKAVGAAFIGTPTNSSQAVANNGIAQVQLGFSNGSHHWQARTIDSAGATSAWVSFGGNAETVADFTVTILIADTTPPSTPGNLTRTTTDTDTTPTFTWTAATDASGIASYEASIDADPYQSIDNVLTWAISEGSPLSVGTHTVRIRAIDNSPNRNIGPAASITFTIAASDTMTPSVPANVTRGSSDTDTTPTFTWNASTDNIGVTGYRVQLSRFEIGSNIGTFVVSPMDIGNVLTYTVPDSLAFSVGPTYEFYVRALDGAGNISGFSTKSPFTINMPPATDTTSPAPPVDPLRTSSDTDLTPTFTWSASLSGDVVSYEVQINSSSYSDTGGMLTFTSTELAVGTHTIRVRARDGAGNVSTTSSLTFTIAATATIGGGGTTGGGTSGGGTTGGGGGTSIVVGASGPPFTLARMEADAGIIVQANGSVLLSSLDYANFSVCQMTLAEASDRTNRVFGMVAEPVNSAMINFTACGTLSTLHLGAGERLGVVNSYKSAFGRLPLTTANWFDVMKIANGRFPGETSASAEAGARARFRTIYLREPNTVASIADTNAVTVMAYGLRPLPRNLNSEAAAISIYKKIFGRIPSSATEWDALRAIAYSGAQR